VADVRPPPGIRIGTSGWNYKAWRGPFYPDALAASRWLAHYATIFDTVEINGSFYRLPSQLAAARWREQTPPGFCFAWKASRFITHMKRLRDPAEPLARVFAPMAALGDKEGPVLFQLPPQMPLDLPRLDTFLLALPPGRRVTIEFRHPSWYGEPVFERLSQAGVALCISDHHHAPAPWVVTAPFVYVRGHGPGGRYAGSYDLGILDDWARNLSAAREAGRPAFVYFDNDIAAAAPEDAQRLRQRLHTR
jgi:uncharacterized protein YecE (DUF72 family)